MITLIKDKYVAEKDQYGWKLHSYHESEKGNIVKVTTFYGTFEQLVKKVMDKEAGEVNGELLEVIEHLSSCVETIVNTVERVNV